MGERMQIKNGDFDLDLWCNMSKQPCPTCYFGDGHYQRLLTDDDDEKNEDHLESEPLYDMFNTQNNKDIAKCIDKKWKNRHRKRKYKEKKRRKEKQHKSKKRRRNNLSLYCKKINFVSL